MRRTETPKTTWCMVVDIADVLTHTDFGDHRLRGFWMAGVKFPPLPLTFIVALTTLSHYRARVRECDGKGGKFDPATHKPLSRWSPKFV